MIENLVSETNSRLVEIINNLTTIKSEYEEKLKANDAEINEQLEKVQKYKEEFFSSKAKIEKMNADIEGFETDYQKLVERFKDDELANILIAANKEISLKIDERKRKIVKDKNAMNELVDKAEEVKSKLVKLTAEKKALELCFTKIMDAYEFYSKSLNEIIAYSKENKDNLTANMTDGVLSISGGIKDITTSDVTESISTIYDYEKNGDFEEETNEENQTVETTEETPQDEVINEEETNEIVQNVNEIEINENEEESTNVDEEKVDETNTVEEIENEIQKEIEESESEEVDDEPLDDLEPVDISDMVKEEEISDYDNEDVIEGDEHKIVINEEEIEESKKNKKAKYKNKEENEEELVEEESNQDEIKDNDIELDDINIDVNFDDSLVDDDSLYE